MGAARGVIVLECANDWELHFENSKNSNILVVIDFKAGWCGPCRLMKPIFAEFASKYTNAVFLEIDVDKFQDLAKKFVVHEIPTFLLIKQGKVVDKVTGANKIELEKAIQNHLNICNL